MKHSTRFLIAGFLLVSTFSVAAASQANRAYALVDSVQMPAWVERNGVRQPLEPGTALHDRDRLVTGADARVLIQLAEGSAVKLGANTQLDLNALGWRENRVFAAVLDVAKGAFRFTTGLFSKRHQQRSVNVRIATITAGIRGTDVWGSADAERDLVCLLEGRITVSHPQDDEVRELSEALSFYTVPKGEAPNPVGRVDKEQVIKWAAKTEVQPGSGYTRRGGRWVVELAIFDGKNGALALFDRTRAAGYAAHIKPRPKQRGGYRYSVRVNQLATEPEAEALAEKLKLLLELSAPVVTKQ